LSKQTNQLSIYSIDDIKYPLYLYQLNEESSIAHKTDNLIFSIQNSTNQENRLWVWSSLLAGNLKSKEKSNKKNSSIFQEFIFPSNQKIMGFLNGFLYENKKSESNYDVEGLFVYSQDTLYELVQKNSPSDIFMNMLDRVISFY
jgi:hypothetical protein